MLSGINNIGFAAQGRSFAGFPHSGDRKRTVVEPRGLQFFPMQAGDLLQLEQGAGLLTLDLMVFETDGSSGAAILNLAGNHALDLDQVDAAPLRAWFAKHGKSCPPRLPSTRVEILDEPLVFRASKAALVWIANPARQDAIIDGETKGTASVTLTQSGEKAHYPLPLGEVIEEIFVPRGTARSYTLFKGQKAQIIDLDGQQCSDFQAASLAGLERGQERFIDNTATRSMVRHAYPSPGLLDKFYDVEMKPMLRVVQDTCGRHDTFGLACTGRSYEERGFPGHLNCSDNISAALDRFGVEKRRAWPAINLFWSTWIDPLHHQINSEESWSRPGDYILMEAMEDLACVSTACPDDIDPINGWNPTDILVRIYSNEEKFSRAVAYREMESAPMLISQQSAFHPRLEPLTEHFAPARDLWAPVSFPSSGTEGEYWACRERVTVQDMSGLRKYDIIGPDAERLLQLATTRNVSKLAQWRGHYTLMCDETGAVIDDGTLFRLAPQLYRWCCGTEESGRHLQALAEANSLQVRINDMRNALPNLAIQGPKSRDLLRKICFTQPHVPALDHIKWFGATIARLNDRDGAPFMLARSGYTGELGYEIFCTKADAVEIWDAIMKAGAEFDILPMGSDALNILRIEAGLAAANAEFAAGFDAFESGLGFAVDLSKTDFIGKEALQAAKANQTKVLKALVFEGDEVPLAGSPVFAGERQIGSITSAIRSPTLERAIAMARLAVQFAEDNTVLEVGQLDGRMKRLSASVKPSPLIDPQRTKARA